MMLANLIRLGEIADSYSHSRRMKITLTLTGEGMLVTGHLFNEFGVTVTHRFCQMVQWQQAFRDEKAVERALKDVHKLVKDAWKANG